MKSLYSVLGLIDPSFEEVILALNSYFVEKKCVSQTLSITPPESLHFLFGMETIPYCKVLAIITHV